MTLLEAERRKTEFLERWTDELPNLRVVWGRAEEQPNETFGVAVAKALAQPPVAAEWCLPLVAEGGAVVLWVGPSADEAAVARGCREDRRRAGGVAARLHGHPQDRPDAARVPAPTRRREEAAARLVGGFGERAAESPSRAARPRRVLSRADSFGYRRSLRPCLGTSIAPRRRAPFRQTLLGRGRCGVAQPHAAELERRGGDVVPERPEVRQRAQLDLRSLVALDEVVRAAPVAIGSTAARLTQ